MPSEPLPWDRKEAFFKDRKHDRGLISDALGGGGGIGGGSCSTSRWRESYHGPRDLPRSSPRRPFPSHYRHGGGYHQIYPEESSVHGCTSSRSGDRSWLDAEICRPSSGRYAGSGRSSSSGGRENRGSFRRSPYLDSVGDCARQNPFPPVTAQRSVALPIAQIQSSSSSLLPLKDHDKSSGGVIDGSGTGQRCDRDLSLGSISWKHRNWSRQSSLPSSKTFRSSSDDACHEASVAQGKDSPLRSPGTSPLPSDDGAPRKKPRLGWGQGLAKYEKQKVEGSVDCNGQNGLMFKDTIGGSSPKVMVFVGSMSPATPTSVTCSSSPGTEEKLSMKTLNLDADRAKDSSRLGLNGSPGNVSIKVGEIDADSVCTLASALNDLMQYEDACSGDSSFARFSTINKLLLLKNEISKELEKTEYEIDLFENELMSLASVEQRNYREHPLKSKSNVGGSSAESFDEPKTSLELPSNNSVLASSVFLEEEKAVQRAVSGECDAEVKVVNHDLTEAFSSGVAQFCLDRQNDNRNVLFDLCSEVNGKSIVPHFIDAEPLTPFTTVTPAVHLSCGLVGNSAAEKKSNSLLASVMNSSSDATKRVSEEFERAMCSMSSQVDIWESDKLLQCRKNYMLIKDKLAVEKRLLKFKERVLAHKFRVLHHLWREDLRLLAVLKHRPKSSKRLEVNIRSSQTALQRHRSSTRSRFLLPAGNLSLVPTTEILNFTSKILSCSQIRHYRNYLKMPAQIIDEKDKTRLRFNTKNGLIEDACSIEKERVAINPWTPEEKELFVNMLATFGKDFRKISSFISHKTTADCIEFYYKNHKAENFKEVMRQLKHRNQWQRLHSNKYLITTGAKWNHEANAASLDFLGVASTPDSRSNNFTRIIPRHKGRSDYHENKILHGVNASLEKANSVEISGTDREAVAADVLVGICGSSEAMSSCATNYIDPRENVLLDRPLTPEVNHAIEEEDTCSDEISVELESADWTDFEKSMFVRAFNMYGKDFVKISEFVKTRSREHCKVFFSKARKCLGLDAIQFGSVNGATPLSDANGGRSDTDDAFVVDSAICSTQSCSKMDGEFTQSMLKSSGDAYAQTNSTTPSQPDRCDYYELGKAVPEEVDGNFGKQAFLNGETFAGDVEYPESGKDQLNSAVNLHAEDKTKPQSAAEISNKTGDTSADALSEDLKQLVGPMVDKRVQVKLENASNVNDTFFLAQNPNSTEHHCSVDKLNNDYCSALTFANHNKLHVPVESLQCIPKEPQNKPVKSDPGVLLDSSSATSNVVDKKLSKSILDLPDQRCKLIQESTGVEFSQQHALRILSSRIDSADVLPGYPLQSAGRIHRDRMHIDMVDEKTSTGSNSKTNMTSLSDCFLSTDQSNDRLGGVAFSAPRSPIESSARSKHKSGRHLAEDKLNLPQNNCLQDDFFAESEDQFKRIGDVKLFGQILTHPSSQKPCFLQEGDIIPASSRQTSSTNTNLPGSWKDASVFPLRPGSNGFLQQGDSTKSGYSLWEGNRLRMGLSSLPESAIILAKYQGTLPGIPFCSIKDGHSECNTGMADYKQQAYMESLSANKKPSLSANKKLLDGFPELVERRNVFDVMPSRQQHGRMLPMGRNVVGGGAIVVGGAAVSDPVASLQVHYSGGRAKILAGDVEQWVGDVGGR